MAYKDAQFQLAMSIVKNEYKPQLEITFPNECFLQINCDTATAYELSDHFSFFAESYKHHPKYKARVWDGKIRLFNLKTRQMYAGLYPYVEQFARDNGWRISVAFPLENNLSLKEAHDWLTTLNLPTQFENRDYQLDTFVHCIRRKRVLMVSPTSSGKSLIIYQILRYLQMPTLVIVPKVSLIHQMASDFVSYGLHPEDMVKIYSGQEKDVKAPVTITTWQSVYKMPSEWFEKFQVIIGDEAHRFKAKSLIDIMTKTPHIAYRYGFSGSLDDLQVNRMVLEGLFGPYHKIISTAELIEQGYAAPIKIKIITLNYNDEERKEVKHLLSRKKGDTKSKYSEEITWLVKHQERNEFIVNLALSLKGNTLILYRLVEDHGKPLLELFKNNVNNQNVYFVHGMVKAEDRERIRKIVNQEDNSITLASIGTFSEGINIPKINNIIFAAPSKSRIQVMQSIGRGLRISEGKDELTLFDIADDLSVGKWKNHTLKHLQERMIVYLEEQFPFKQYRVKL